VDRINLILAAFLLQASTMLTIGVAHSAPQIGQIIVDPQNPAWLIYNGGGPFFMSGPGDPEGFLYRGTRNFDGSRSGDQLDLINKLKASGANCIYLMAVRSHGGDGGSFENPYVDADPTNGLDNDILDQWESWFTEMDKNGIVIYFFFYDDSSSIWNTGDNVESAEISFIQGLVNKFEHHKHLIWAVAEEYQEKFTAARVKNIAAQIRVADDYNHVIAVHKLSGLSFTEFADDPNIDQFAIQYNADTEIELHNGMLSAWENAKGKYNLNMSEVAYGGIGTGAEARRSSWAIAMGGAYVMINGMTIDTTPQSDLEDHGRMVEFFESTNFNQMAPHDELAFAGTQYVMALAGDSYIAYASGLVGNIGIKSLSAGVYDFKWFDTTTGASVIEECVLVEAGDSSWPTPQGIGDELAVHIKIKTSYASEMYVSKDGSCGGKIPCYTSIQAAINAASTGTAIRIAQGTYTESITLSTSISLTLQGGWNFAFSSQTPNTTFIKAPKPTQGSLTVQEVVIKP